LGEGIYVYGILEGVQRLDLGKIGLLDREVFSISHKDLSALVSSMPLKQTQSNIEQIAAHQRVIEASRDIGTILPVRFGTIFKAEEGVRKLLAGSYRRYKSKISKLKGKDEFGVKIILENGGIEKIQRLVRDESDTIKKMKEQGSTVGEGTSYFLKLRMDEAIKNETLKKIDQLRGEIHNQLANCAESSCMLESGHDQIVLNGAYLVNSNVLDSFKTQVGKLKEKYKYDGLIFHVSGPWAPYSFC
jgi:hypothetical protein